MKEHVRLAYQEYGFQLPEEHRFTILCRWKPPKELWPTLGKRWRDIAVELLGANKPDVLADELSIPYCHVLRHRIGPSRDHTRQGTYPCAVPH